MENYGFWCAFSSVCFGAIVSLWHNVCMAFEYEVQKLGLAQKSLTNRILRPMLMVFPLILFLCAVCDVIGLRMNVLWVIVGALPIEFNFDNQAVVRKIQPFLWWLRKRLYRKLIADGELKDLLIGTETKEDFYHLVSKGFVLDSGEYMYKDANGFHDDLQNFLDRQQSLKIPDWKIDILKECGYRLSDKIISED